SAGSTQRFRRQPAIYQRLSGAISELAAMQFVLAEIFAIVILGTGFPGAAYAPVNHILWVLINTQYMKY
ncbi:MAG: hypothetical protein ABR885_17530, partial [Mycobacterium sp.]